MRLHTHTHPPPTINAGSSSWCDSIQKRSRANVCVWDRVEGDLVERLVEGDSTPCLTLGLVWVVRPVEDEALGLRFTDGEGALVRTEIETEAPRRATAEARSKPSSLVHESKVHAERRIAGTELNGETTRGHIESSKSHSLSSNLDSESHRFVSLSSNCESLSSKCHSLSSSCESSSRVLKNPA